jgi:hypothetical protein
MKLLAAVLGVALILAIPWDAFEAIILPRVVTRRIRLTGLFYQSFWIPWSALVRRVAKPRAREKYLGFFGPLSLLILLAIWAICLIVGYGLVYWGTNTPLHPATNLDDFPTCLYFSGVTFFTLGYGDVSPASPFGRTLSVIETANGFGLLAIVISYLPTLYQNFSTRETSISLLDAHSGSPSSAVELLRRQQVDGKSQLDQLLREWERWSAELLESHLSYPVLCYFRSQHDNQSWLRAMTTVLDTCALVLAGVKDGPAWQARMTFAMARHAVVDIAQILGIPPHLASRVEPRLSHEDVNRARQILSESGIVFCPTNEEEDRLNELRSMYEPYVSALSEWLLMPLPPWILPKDAIDNWKTSAWGRLQ